MDNLDNESLKAYLHACGGCGKQHINIGNLYGGNSFCVTCVPKVKQCNATGIWTVEKKLTFFEEQGI